MCQGVKQSLSRDSPVPTSVLCIESNQELFVQLQENIKEFPFAQAVHGKFTEFIRVIETKATNHSVFLYLDPYTVEGLEWNLLDSVLKHLAVSKMSIELLMNFNACSFVRRGLAALSLAVPPSDPAVEDTEQIDAAIDAPASVQRLNAVVGGEWWRSILKSQTDFVDIVKRVTDVFRGQLSKRFKYVCQHGVKALPHHAIPKYYLLFGSRHPDALILMNDQMAKSRQELAELAKPEEPMLFETRSEELVPDMSKLPEIVLQYTRQPIRRDTVILNVIQEHFCQYTRSEIRRCIEELLKNGKLKSEIGKVRINDRVKIWATV